MRVALVASYAPSLIKFRRELIMRIIDGGHKVFVGAPDFDDVTLRQLNELGAHVYCINFDRGGVDPVKDVKTLWELVKWLYSIQPDIVISYTIKPVIYASLAARIVNIPKVYSIITGVGSNFIDAEVDNWLVFKQRLLRRIIKLLYRIALTTNEHIFFQNPDDAALFLRLKLVKKIRTKLINGSGVNLEYFSHHPPLRKETISFLLIARLIRDKGIVEYMTAARILLSKYENVLFRLAGWHDPHNPTSIPFEQVARWHEEGVVDYLGPVNDVRPLLIDSSVYVLPSYREGLPRTNLEAMAIGRPIVTTATAGCRETVDEGVNGFLVPVRDHIALASAMEKFILNPELIEQMGSRSRDIAVDRFDVNNVNDSLIMNMGLGGNCSTRF